MTPSPVEWPVPSAVAVGSWDSKKGQFSARKVVPVTFVQEGVNYSVSVELPSNTTDTAMALAFPSALAVENADNDSHFQGAINGETYVAWRALTAMSGINGALKVDLVEGLVELAYSFV